MQLFVRTTVGRTVVLDAEPDFLVCDLKQRLEERESIPAEEQFLVWGGRTLDDASRLSDCNIQNGATLSSHLRLRGGAAAKAKEAAKLMQKKLDMAEEYKTWHTLADQTETSGVMRVLCVSMVLEKDRNPIHIENDDDGPKADKYDGDFEVGKLQRVHTGYPKQENFDEAFSKLMDKFENDHWSMMTVYGKLSTDDKLKYKRADGDEVKHIYLHRDLSTEYLKDLGDKHPEDNIGLVEIVCGAGDGLWFKGPTQIVLYESGEKVWDLAEKATEGEIWCKDKTCFRDPWKIDGQYAAIERWMYSGIGTTTYTLNAKNKMTLWSQEDTDSAIGLTDREKMRLRQMMQITAKESMNKKLSPEEKELQILVNKLVELAPCSREGVGIYSWRIKPLKKILENKVVFWSNTEDTLPKGSVADQSTDAAPKGGIQPNGAGNEIIEFWKYEKKIGALRKKYIIEDRQRLLDTIERFTPTYKAVIKNCGLDATEDGGDHYMTPDFQKKITNVVALALDMNMPDCEEDKIACFIKTLVEKRMGPTWHVLVGRSFGFSVQCEARHFLHLYMQHLAVVIWKSEPDPNAGKKS